mgnify:CR=1 FL=1
MSFFENTRKPVGLGGKIMVAMMNLGHSPVARWGLRFFGAYSGRSCWTAAAAEGRTSRDF